MPPRGGLADKIGNRYEGRIAVRRILQLLDEQHDSVREAVTANLRSRGITDYPVTAITVMRCDGRG